MTISKQLEEAIASNLLEASLGRIYQHHKERPFVILTSWRGERSLEENKASLKALKKQIRSSGHGFVQLDGVGQEVSSSGKIVEASEPSLLVPAKEKGEDKDKSFIKLALKWARSPGGDSKAAQDFVFYANGAGQSALVNAKGGDNFKLGKFNPNSIGEFYSKLRSGRTFKFDDLKEVRYAPMPSNYLEGMGRESEGEIFTFCGPAKHTPADSYTPQEEEAMDAKAVASLDEMWSV